MGDDYIRRLQQLRRRRIVDRLARQVGVGQAGERRDLFVERGARIL
jgi:hypothetical protein